MLTPHTILYRSLLPLARTITSSSSSSSSLQQAVKNLVEAKSYGEIPNLFASSKPSKGDPNPFLFLSSIHEDRRTRIVDDILQSWIPLRPWSHPRTAYSCLLTYILQSPSSLPLALAVLQQILRSGSMPEPQTHLMLSSAWIDCVSECGSAGSVLRGMKSIGYPPDCGTVNYIIYSLCSVDRLREAANVLMGMGGAGCAPDPESYGIVIAAFCGGGKTADAVDLLEEMVVRNGLMPHKGTVGKVVAALRADREVKKAVDVVELLEREGYHVHFEVYESVLEGCVERKEHVLAGKVGVRMADRGFIPYIKIRQKVVDGLITASEWDLACVVRQRFAELSS